MVAKSSFLVLVGALLFAQSLAALREIHLRPSGATVDWTTAGGCTAITPCYVSSSPLTTSNNDAVHLFMEGGTYTTQLSVSLALDVQLHVYPWGAERVTLTDTSFWFTSASSAGELRFTNITLDNASVLSSIAGLFSSLVFENCTITGNTNINAGPATSVDFIGTTLVLKNSLATAGASPSTRYNFVDCDISCALTSCESAILLQPKSSTTYQVQLQNVTLNGFVRLLDSGPLSVAIQYSITDSDLTFSGLPGSQALLDSPGGPASVSLTQSNISCTPDSSSTICNLLPRENDNAFTVTQSRLTRLSIDATTPESIIDFSLTTFFNCAINSIQNTAIPKIIGSEFISSTTTAIISNSEAYLEGSSFLPVPRVASSVPQLALFGTHVKSAPLTGSYTPTLKVHRLSVDGDVQLPIILTITADHPFDPNTERPITGVLQAVESQSADPFAFRNASGVDMILSASQTDTNLYWVFDGPVFVNQVIIAGMSRFQVNRHSDLTEITFSLVSASSEAFNGGTPQIGIDWPADVAFVPNSGVSFPILQANFSLPMNFTQANGLTKSGYSFQFATVNQSKRSGSGLVKFNAAPVPAAPAYPPFSTLPIPIPAPVSGGCGPEPLPKGLFQCQNGTWVSNSSIGSGNGTLTISTPVIVRGNFSVGSIEFVGLNSTIDVVGCASLPSQVTVTLTIAEYEALKRNGTRYADLIKSLCADSSGLSVNIDVHSPSKKSCEKVKATLESNEQIMTGVFKIDSSQCNVWWIVLIAVLGGVVLIVIALALIFTCVPAARECIRPYVRRGKYRNSIDH